MNTAIQFSESEEARAMQLLFRQFSGTMLSDRRYIVGQDALRALTDAGIEFTVLDGQSDPRSLPEVVAGERV